jgi:hypothetical protein
MKKFVLYEELKNFAEFLAYPLKYSGRPGKIN